MSRTRFAELARALAPADASGWRMGAACGPDTAHLFSTVGVKARGVARLPTGALAALRICQGCPVRQQCYEAAAASPVAMRSQTIAGGVWWDVRGDPNPVCGPFGRPSPSTPAMPCGTRSAAERHRRRGEPLDAACEAARRAWYAARSRRVRALLKAAA